VAKRGGRVLRRGNDDVASASSSSSVSVLSSASSDSVRDGARGRQFLFLGGLAFVGCWILFRGGGAFVGIGSLCFCLLVAAVVCKEFVPPVWISSDSVAVSFVGIVFTGLVGGLRL
jgi:hypothetical protein